jgi:hypothetical protein
LAKSLQGKRNLRGFFSSQLRQHPLLAGRKAKVLWTAGASFPPTVAAANILGRFWI